MYFRQYRRRLAYRRRRRFTRRPYRKRPAYRKRTRRVTKYTKRAILNTTSRKKRDHMLQTYKPSVTQSPTGVGSIAFGPSVSAATRWWAYGWIASARDNGTTAGTFGSVYDESTRTASTCYIKGLKERVQLRCNNGHAFLWRRLVFAFTGQEIIRDQASAVFGTMWNRDDTHGYTRATTQLLPSIGSDATYAWNQMASIIFRGVANVDWNNITTAPIDNTRIKVLHDQTIRVVPQTADGLTNIYHKWHPINKNLVYNDDEVGGGKIPGIVLSANNRQSCGDIYVVDMFDVGSPEEGNVFDLDIESTFYWHEK